MATSGANEPRMRADALMVRRGLAASRDRAQALIAEGGVLVDGMPLAKPAKKLPADAEITMTTVDIPWVSRGALKLVGGLEAFPVIDPAGLSCADIGASTGGPRVTSREGLNARHLSAEDFATPPQLIVCDASFISLTKVLPVVMDLAAPEALLLALVKPQFEVGRAQIGKGGIVRDRQAVADAVARIEHWLVADMGWELIGTATSPIDGQDGNREFLMAGRKSRNG